MSEKMDRRQARTKQLLHKALMELMEEKSADAITVTDISSRADINRGTFYLHYQDVPDMLEQLKEEVFAKISSFILQMDPRELHLYASSDEPYPNLVLLFEEFARHADFLKVMFGPNGDLSYAIRFRKFMAAHIFNKLTYLQPQEDHLLIPRDYLIAYMSSANFGMLMHWFESGMNHSPHQLGVIMTQILNHGPMVSSGLKGKLPPSD
jgi:AcrR family transcriptional regulator